MNEPELKNQRILIVDDNQQIHKDFESILLPRASVSDERLDDFSVETSEETGNHKRERNGASSISPVFEISHAYQGEEAFRMVVEAEGAGKPFATIFVDVRMPPGWNGIETIRRIWSVSPDTEVIICTAYSDYDWEDIVRELGSSDQLQFLRKPFDVVSVKQMALAMVRKWNLVQRARQYTEQLEEQVAERTKELNEKVDELKSAMKEIHQLRGILPMCAWCHKIRTDDDYWHQVDEYLDNYTNMDISHSMCPECYEKIKKEIPE